MKIVLIGFMGCGKSTLGRPLARALGYGFVDLDHHIEQCEGQTISEIFAQHGEQAFRSLESRYLREVLEREDIVISAGGGTPCFNDNMDYLATCATTVYIKLSPEMLVSRLEGAHTPRPLIRGKSHDELLEYVRHTLCDRERYYDRASIVVDNPARDVTRIINILKYDEK